jgi:succinyl-CoA synthetase beta subunit
MRLFEYQAKLILKEEGLLLPKSILLNQLSDITIAIQEIGLPLVLKSQTLIGGRGKAGGIQVVHTEDEAQNWYNEKIGSMINGKRVESILAEELIQIETEYYVGFTLDTQVPEVKLLFSSSGGIHVEETKESGLLFAYKVPLEYGIDEFKVIEILSRANVPKKNWSKLIETMHDLYQIFLKSDCMLLEVNPLVCTTKDEIQILDVHMYIDDNAIQRQPVAKQIITNLAETYPQEWYKTKYGFDFVTLNPKGSVGLLTTGAGLTMATIDELSERNIEPINFADMRSGQLKGDPTRIILMLEELSKQTNLRCIFVSIFAGITDLAEFTKTLLEAKSKVAFSNQVEWIIRMEGNNYIEAKEMLEATGLFVTNSLELAIERIEKGVVMN